MHGQDLQQRELYGTLCLHAWHLTCGRGQARHHQGAQDYLSGLETQAFQLGSVVPPANSPMSLGVTLDLGPCGEGALSLGVPLCLLVCRCA